MSLQQASERRRHTILLGGIGYLGTQNTLAYFFQMPSLTNVVMISSMDGHARYYLREFPAFRREFKTYGKLSYPLAPRVIKDFVDMEKSKQEKLLK